jgi:methyl-accepting chemotaxis protein
MLMQKLRSLQAQLAALEKSQAVIEFDPHGIILNANQNFLNVMGYSLAEIQGKHHRMFADPAYAASPEYEAFWESLRRGEYSAAEFHRLGKNGKKIWIQASYNPVHGRFGKVIKVVKYATDITEQKLKNADYAGQIAAIGKSQAVIEFDLQGTILKANQNFLNAMGYTLAEIQGKHHRMFVDPAYAASTEYEAFWENLRRGEYSAAEFQRFGKNGKKIWIQASYNPILDMNGKPFKVIKYATDITEQKLKNADYAGQIEAIGKSQAVIEFDLQGTILKANQNFLNVMGYSLAEIQGKHHRMFADPTYAASREYEAFWERLRQGEPMVSEFQRFGKGGKEVWIQASYNPILDMNGKPFKVVKYASDITNKVKSKIESKDISESLLESIHAVAAATEEMTASISEISKNMGQSKQSIDDIVLKNSHADGLMSKLQETTSSMESVVQLINTIAAQVNLLSLNATIEAARAGEAGKGFAVVAAEVKNLATQTSKATEEIAIQITALQKVAAEVTASSVAISTSTGSVSASVSGVASAIEEQSVVTQDISSNMHKASDAVAQLNACIKRAVSG